jgi:3'(2'), 5'-bisphosphate nucleotidase
MDDHQLAADLAARAGTRLLEIRARGGAEGDRQSNELRVWIVDPLDGAP